MFSDDPNHMGRFYRNTLYFSSAIIFIILWIGIPIPIAWVISKVSGGILLFFSTEWLWFVPYYTNGAPAHLIIDLLNIHSPNFLISLCLLISIGLLLFRSIIDFNRSIYVDGSLFFVLCLLAIRIVVGVGQFELGFGMILYGANFVLISRGIYQNYKGINLPHRINRDPVRLHWEYPDLIIGIIIIIMAFVQHIGFLPCYYIRNSFIDYYLWGTMGHNEGDLYIFLANLEPNSIFFIFMWGVVFFSGVLAINIARPNIAYRHIKKTIKLIMLNLGFSLIIIILFFVFSLSQGTNTYPGPIPFTIVGILAYFGYKYRRIFVVQTRKKQIRQHEAVSNVKNRIESEAIQIESPQNQKEIPEETDDFHPKDEND